MKGGIKSLIFSRFLFSYFDRIDDILADSDSELENDIIMDDEQKPDQRPKKKARSKDERYIHEDIDDIVDLADVNAMSKITCKLKNIIVLFLKQNSKSFKSLFLFFSYKTG